MRDLIYKLIFMKRKLLLLLLLANFSIYAQYTAIPDINFEKKLIALGIDSGATDGQVLTSKIYNLTYLSIENSSITDLTGIEAFVSLESLYCTKNSLTSINLSQNTKLINLNVQIIITKLIYLDCQEEFIICT